MLEKNILLQGLEILKEKQRLSTDSYTDVKLFLDKVDKSEYKVFSFDDFNKTKSLNLTFDSYTGSIKNNTVGNLFLYSDPIDIKNIIIKGIIFDDELKRNVDISINGVDYRKLNTFNANEVINNDGFNLKIEMKPTETLKSFYLIYDIV